MVLGHSAPNNNSMTLPNVPSEELCRWGPQCSVCAQSDPHPELEGSNWEKDDWNGNIQKGKMEEKQKKEEELRRKLTAEQHTGNYYPPNPQYRLSYKENPINV